MAIEFVRWNTSRADLTTQLTSILAAKSRAVGMEAVESAIEIVPDQHTNQLLLIGPQATVQEAQDLVRSLDQPLGLVTRTYQFTNVRATKIDELVRALVVPSVGDRQYRSVTDDVENVMIVTAPSAVHEQIEQLRRVRDVPLPAPESPIRFYKIKNLPVQELLETIRSIETNTFVDLTQRTGGSALPTDGRIRPARSHAVPGPNQLPGPAGTTVLPVPPAVVLPREQGGQVPTQEAPGGPGASMPPQPDAGAGMAAPSGELLGRARISGTSIQHAGCRLPNRLSTVCMKS